MNTVAGLHHVTAVARDPQLNIDFYQQILGQRLIKTTVNFDDPGTYHLYYGDYKGIPGTALTFFPWMHVKAGVHGNGETNALAYQVPQGSLGFWQARLKKYGFYPARVEQRFGREVLPFSDPEGMVVELIETEALAPVDVWQDGPVPAEMSLRGFDGVTLWISDLDSTIPILTNVFDYRFLGQEGNRYRYAAQDSNLGGIVDLVHLPNASRAQFGGGSIHHIAFRAQDDQHQLALRNLVLQHGIGITEVIDRQYFRSVYFRIPAGVLFEIATDGPGFTIDESLENLGQSLRLPPWYENKRAEIEAILPPIDRNLKAEVLHE